MFLMLIVTLHRYQSLIVCPSYVRNGSATRSADPSVTLRYTDAILDFRSCLELSVEEAREALAKCDLGCPFVHYQISGFHSSGLKRAPHFVLHW